MLSENLPTETLDERLRESLKQGVPPLSDELKSKVLSKIKEAAESLLSDEVIPPKAKKEIAEILEGPPTKIIEGATETLKKLAIQISLTEGTVSHIFQPGKLNADKQTIKGYLEKNPKSLNDFFSSSLNTWLSLYSPCTLALSKDTVTKVCNFLNTLLSYSDLFKDPTTGRIIRGMSHNGSDIVKGLESLSELERDLKKYWQDFRKTRLSSGNYNTLSLEEQNKWIDHFSFCLALQKWTTDENSSTGQLLRTVAEKAANAVKETFFKELFSKDSNQIEKLLDKKQELEGPEDSYEKVVSGHVKM